MADPNRGGTVAMGSAFGSFGAGEKGMRPGSLLKPEMQKGPLKVVWVLGIARVV